MHIPVSVFVGLVGWVFLSVVLLIRSRKKIDRGSRIFNCPSNAAARAVAEIVSQYHIEPRYRFDTTLVKRILFDDGTVVTVTDHELRAIMGNCGAGIALTTPDPERAAVNAACFLEEQGFEATVLGALDPEASPNIIFLASNAFDGWLLIFRQSVPIDWAPPRWD